MFGCNECRKRRPLAAPEDAWDVKEEKQEAEPKAEVSTHKTTVKAVLATLVTLKAGGENCQVWSGQLKRDSLCSIKLPIFVILVNRWVSLA